MTGVVCETCGCVVPVGEEKTLLDEFAMAAMAAIVGKNKPQTVGANEWEVEHMIAIGSYDYARAMMKERARRDEMGNVKEVEK